MGERVVRNDEVRGSIPLGSTSAPSRITSPDPYAAARQGVLLLLHMLAPGFRAFVNARSDIRLELR